MRNVKACVVENWEGLNPLSFEDDGYPEIVFFRDAVRVTLGWFFAEEYSDEQASYIEVLVDIKGKSKIVLNVGCFNFDFVTKLSDYGYWVEPTEYDRAHGAKPCWHYLDNHIQLRNRIIYLLKNLPFRTKQKLHHWALRHVPIYKRLSNWRYQRYCKKIFEVKK
jgi:hypothetical protein